MPEPAGLSNDPNDPNRRASAAGAPGIGSPLPAPSPPPQLGGPLPQVPKAPTTQELTGAVSAGNRPVSGGPNLGAPTNGNANPLMSGAQAQQAQLPAWQRQSQNPAASVPTSWGFDGTVAGANAHQDFQQWAQNVTQAGNYGQQASGGGNNAQTYVDKNGNIQFAGQVEGQQGAEFYDPNSAGSQSFNYGGTRTGAQDARARYQGMGAAAMGAAPIQANYGQADQARGLGSQSRGSQQDALNMYRNAALGQGPSAAQSQFQTNLDQSMAAQLAMANSGRGGAASRAGAQLRAQSAMGQQLAQSTSQAAALRAQEMQQAQAGYAGLGSQMRAGDLSQQGQDAQQALAQAQLGLGSRQLAQQGQLAYEGMGQNVDMAQLQGGEQKQKLIQDYQNMRLGEEAQKRAASTAREQQGMQIGGSAAMAALGALAFISDIGAKENVKSGGAEVRKTLDALSPKTYDYKERVGGEKDQAGIIAQDLEKTPLGRAAVISTPAGKAVRVDKAVSLALASVADIHKRLKALEKSHG